MIFKTWKSKANIRRRTAESAGAIQRVLGDKEIARGNRTIEEHCF